MKDTPEPIVVERVQTGIRVDKNILKVLKALAEYFEMSLGDLIEGIVLHAFDGKTPFGADTLERIRTFKQVYRLDLDHTASHRLVESTPAPAARTRRKPARPRRRV